MKKKEYRRRFAGFDLDARTGRTSALGDSLSGWLSSHGMQPRQGLLGQLWKNWNVVMGPLAELAHPLGHRNNILLIGGDDPCAMQELSYATPELLERANAFMNEEFFLRVELHLLMGQTSLRRVDITDVPPPPPPQRPPRLGSLRISPDSPVAACYQAYLRCFNKDA